MIRGAANQQGKDWGIFITWKYQQPPYLDNGTTILDQMTTAYQCGAKYVVLFNYYDAENSTLGTMQPEHFQALQAFWDSVATNPKISRGSIIVDSAVVLPKNYGWGTRWNGDHIWGIFNADQKTSQMWELMQQALRENGLKTDLVYGDNNSQFLAGYKHVYRCDNLE
jgi:hypothetical protein